jgi:hypothetical protein
MSFAKKIPTPTAVAAATTKAKRRTKLERELDAGAFCQLQQEREHNTELDEKLRAAEIKVVGLESEVAELKRENADLRRRLQAAEAEIEQFANLDYHADTATTPPDDGLDIPEFLRRDLPPKGVAA